MHFMQRTLAQPASCTGVGVHSGKKVNLTLKPAPINHGIQFQRTDLPDSPKISAHFNRVVDTSLATVIGSNGCIVSTIEHVMACFAGLSIDNALVELNDYEVPVMDGSAGPFTEMINNAGIVEQESPRQFFIIKKPIELQYDGKSVSIFPADTFRITCSIDFNHPLIKKQTYDFDLSDTIFESEISRARTFGFFHEFEQLQRFGLAKGGSLENVIVLDTNQIMNEDGLRYPDEFVRHKILDCLGDFSLLGMPILGHLVVNKSGHAFNHAFLEKFFDQKESWETSTILHFDNLSQHHSNSLAI